MDFYEKWPEDALFFLAQRELCKDENLNNYHTPKNETVEEESKEKEKDKDKGAKKRITVKIKIKIIKNQERTRKIL
jgi:hypothetical protein